MQKPSNKTVDSGVSHSSVKSYFEVHPIGPVLLNGAVSLLFWTFVATAIYAMYVKIASASTQGPLPVAPQHLETDAVSRQ